MFFARKLGIYVTSCDERRLGQWEKISWGDYTRDREMSEEYRKLFTRGITRNLAAMKADDASTHSIGLVGEATVMSIMGRGNEPGGTVDRIVAPGTPSVRNDEPLLIQSVDSWKDRPDSATKVPNLFLAGDWVRTSINVTTMEGANAGGRQAVNALLDAAGSPAERCSLHPLYVPPEYEAFKAADRERYARGLPHMFDGA